MNRPLVRGFCLLLLLLCAEFSIRAAAGDDLFNTGLEAGRAGQFSQAARAFQESLDRQPAAGTLLNLGIADWRRGLVGEAVLSWERAAWLDPFDQEARSNLRFVRETAQVDAPDLAWPELASTWLPASTWAWLAAGSLWVAVALVVLPGVLRVRRAGWHRALAAGAGGIFILSLAPNLGVITRSSLGIVLDKKTVLRLTPTQEGEAVVILTAGEAARKIRERGSQVMIRTSRGSGWVERRQFGLFTPLASGALLESPHGP